MTLTLQCMQLRCTLYHHRSAVRMCNQLYRVLLKSHVPLLPVSVWFNCGEILVYSNRQTKCSCCTFQETIAISCMVKSISLPHYCATSTGYCTILEGSGHTRPGQFEINHTFQQQAGSLQCRCKYIYSHTWHILKSCYTCGSSLFEYTA